MNDHGGPLSRRRLLRALGGLGMGVGGAALLAGATGCLAGPSIDEPPAPKGTKVEGDLTVVTPADAASQVVYERVYDVFRRKYPDVNLITQYISGATWPEFFEAIAVRIAGGKSPDVIRIAIEGARVFTGRKLLVPLDAYIDRDADELADFFDDVHPRLMTSVTEEISPDGRTYYLPGGFNPMVMWCNKETFGAAGVDVPEDGWTWDDFRSGAERLAAVSKFGCYVQAAYFGGIMPWALTNGGNVMNADWTVSTVNSAETVEAVEFMKALVDDGLSPKPGGTFNAVAASAQGGLPMFGGTRSSLVGIRQQKLQSKIKAVAWPANKKAGTPIGVLGFPILSQSRNKEAGWAFAKTLASAEANQIIARDAPIFVPPRRSAAESADYQFDAPERMAATYETIEYGTTLPCPEKNGLIEQEIIDNLSQVLAGNLQPGPALDQLHEAITGLL